MDRNTAPATTKENSMNYTIDLIDINTINSSRGSKFVIEFDTAPSAWVDIIRFDADTKTGLARSFNTGQLYAFEITGRKVINEVIRVAVYPLTDICLAEGKLAALVTRRQGGVINGRFYYTHESL
jgi:hypothetical protein